MDVFAEHFGENLGDAVRQELGQYSQAIEFLENSQRVSRYLTGDEEHEDRILMWRARLEWFDCALLMLEGYTEALADYASSVREKAFYHLGLYYRPSQEQVQQACRSENLFRAFWHWLISQGNPLINSFLNTWRHAQTITLPIPAANAFYENGSPCQNVSFALDQGPAAGCTVTCQISFYWIKKKTYIDDKTWGKVEIKVDKPDKDFTEQKKQFLSMLYIDLEEHCTQSRDKQRLAQNLHCNNYGEFAITQNLDKIKRALDKNSLSCILKLSHC